MSRVRIFRHDKTATQSGRAGTDEWLVQFEVEPVRIVDGDMQWKSSTDTHRQLRISFSTLAEAEYWAKQAGHSYRVLMPRDRKIKPKAYANNFAYDRAEPWTH